MATRVRKRDPAIRYCQHCGKPCLKFKGPSPGVENEFLPGTTKIGGARHGYSCDQCRREKDGMP